MSVIGTTDLRSLLRTIVPALASSGEGSLSTLVGSHVFDQKLDGVRALAAFDEDGLTLRNRNGRDLTLTYPDLAAGADGLLPHPLILDGEIVAQDGAFQDIARRDRLTKPFQVAQAMRTTPARFVAFDVLWAPERGDVRHLPYRERRALLDALGLSSASWGTSRVSDSPALYEEIKAAGGEGVIAKRLTSPYGGGRSSSWQKFKTTQSVTCIAIGYEEGQGKRAFMGAIMLAMLGPEGAVVVGKAGSGFTDRSAREMKDLLDAAAVALDPSLLPIVEIECLGRTRENKLRQPTYKGIRIGDCTLADASISQLDAVPRS